MSLPLWAVSAYAVYIDRLSAVLISALSTIPAISTRLTTRVYKTVG